MDLKTLLTGIKLILTTNPINVLKSWAVGDDEQARLIRSVVHSINFIAANLGIIILLLSAYVWFAVTSPDRFQLVDTNGHVLNINDISKIRISCLMLCSQNTTDIKSIP
jgi:hypothetical protein